MKRYKDVQIITKRNKNYIHSQKVASSNLNVRLNRQNHVYQGHASLTDTEHTPKSFPFVSLMRGFFFLVT